MIRHRILVGLCIACSVFAAAASAQQPNVDPLPIGAIADKLGVKLLPSAPNVLELGRSATLTLAEPQKLAPFGIKGMHEGARVTITCVGPNRVRVEAEEMQPIQQREVVTLRVADDGTLTQVPDRPPQTKPPTL